MYLVIFVFVRNMSKTVSAEAYARSDSGNFDLVEYCSVRVKLTGRWFTLSCVYMPPSPEDNEDALGRLFNLGHDLYVGDFNSRSHLWSLKAENPSE